MYWKRAGACKSVATLLVPLLALLASPRAEAGKGTVFETLIRDSAKVADDVPLRQADELAEELAKSKLARGAVDAELGRSGKISDSMGEAEKAAVRSREVLVLLRQATLHLDPDLVRAVEHLDDASRESALVLARGSERVRQALPDLAARGRFLREGGPETVAAVGLHGQDVAKAAVRLDEAIAGGSVILREGQRAVTLGGFGRVMSRFGDASWLFWQQYIQPHWKLWAASGALAAYLSNPEYFQDAAGRMTEAGFKHLAEFVGAAAAGSIRGVGTGTGNAVDAVGKAVRDTYFSGWRSLEAVLGTTILIVIISWLVLPIRRIWQYPLNWLHRARQNP